MLLGNLPTQTAKERRKKVTKGLNKDLMSLAEDPEMKFEEAAPLLFGASFVKKMKDHLESLRCLRQSMNPKCGSRGDQFFQGGRRQYLPRGGGSNFRGRDGQRFHPYPHQRGGRESDSKCSRNRLRDSYAWKALPVVHILPELKKFYSSVTVNQLMGLEIAPLATELAKRILSLAGRFQHFKSNWVKITQDPWVLETIQGYRVHFSQQPYQPYPPRALTQSQAEEVLMQQIQSILEKHAIEETTPRGVVSCQRG